MTAYGYVRKSVMADDSTTLSPAVQEERIRALAAAHGDDDVTILRDLDVSGAKVEQRRGYMEMVSAIEDGDAHSVYAYDLSRLHRNTREALRFFELCEDRRVPVRLVSESIDTSGPTGRLMLTILAAMNAWVSQVTSAKIKESLARRERDTGKRNGGRPYGTAPGEDAQAVVAAFREAGSFTGAARLLNQRGVRTRNPGASWKQTSVRSVLERVAPEVLPAVAVKGSKAGPREARFARLLRCSVCGAMLTPSYDGGHQTMRYYCHAASVTPHGRKTIPEAKLLPQFEEEMNHARTIVKRFQRGSAGDEAKLEELARRRERLSRQHEAGLIDDATMRERLGAIADEERGLSVRRSFRRITIPVAVEDEPAKVNGYLSKLMERVEVDMSGAEGRGGEPALTFQWRDPSMRIPLPLDDAG